METTAELVLEILRLSTTTASREQATEAQAHKSHAHAATAGQVTRPGFSWPAGRGAVCREAQLLPQVSVLGQAHWMLKHLEAAKIYRRSESGSHKLNSKQIFQVYSQPTFRHSWESEKCSFRSQHDNTSKQEGDSRNGAITTHREV